MQQKKKESRLKRLTVFIGDDGLKLHMYLSDDCSERDVTAGKILVGHLRWWAESAPLPPLGLDRFQVSENSGATAVAPVAPVDTSLKVTRILMQNERQTLKS